MRGAFKLGKIAGIEIGIHYTWIFALVLFAWLFAQGTFPAVRQGRYVRVREADLSQWIEAHRKKPLDKQVYTMYSSSHDRQTTSTDQNKDATHTSRIRGPRKRNSEHDSSPGAR